MKKQEIISAVQEFEKKYFDLVWLARVKPEFFNEKNVKENIDRIKEEYPVEVENYINSDNRDWDFGFNSGMLAGMRYVATLFYEDRETADEEFPFLDT